MILALRVLLTPLLVVGATLAGRRWGPEVTGWLIGFPLTSAPVSFILALQDGTAFAAHAAIGNMAGLASICVFCLVYGAVSRQNDWPISAAAAAAAFFMATALWNSFVLPLIPTFVVTVLAIGLLLVVVPRARRQPVPVEAPRWDIPARIVIAMAFVLLVTGFSSVLGAQLSGLLTPFPVFATVLGAFAHRQQGAPAALQLMRGMLLSLFGVAGFFLVVAGLLPTLGVPLTYTLATLVNLASNGLALTLTRRHDPGNEPA